MKNNLEFLGLILINTVSYELLVGTLGTQLSTRQDLLSTLSTYYLDLWHAFGKIEKLLVIRDNIEK
jgi:hypothetical protein